MKHKKNPTSLHLIICCANELTQSAIISSNSTADRSYNRNRLKAMAALVSVGYNKLPYIGCKIPSAIPTTLGLHSVMVPKILFVKMLCLIHQIKKRS